MRKTTLGRELGVLNGKQMTLGHKWEKRLRVVSSGLQLEKKLLYGVNKKQTTLGCEVRALSGKEITLGDKCDKRL